MGSFKSFLFGIFTAYGIYFITKKGDNGKSILDDLLADPSGFMEKAKAYAIDGTVKVVKNKISKAVGLYSFIN